METAWSALYSSLAKNAAKKRQIFIGTFELTSRCNLQCIMCYVCGQTNDQELKSRELTAKQWIELGRQARDEGMVYLTLTGGEIFLRPDFREIYEGLMELGLVIQLYTNATMITPEIIEWLKKMPPKKVSITLYGKDAETYQKITGFADGYDRAVRAIDMLLENGIQIEIKTTIVKGIKDQFPEIMEFAKQKGVKLGVVNYVSPRREGTNSDPRGNRLTPKELADFEEALYSTNLERKKARLEEENVLMSDSGESGNGEDKSKEKQEYKYIQAFECAVGKTATWIAWDGRMIACGTASGIATYPLEVGMHDAWEELKRQCDNVPMCEECKTCEYVGTCDKCPARMEIESGKMNQKAEYLCGTAKARHHNIKNRV